MKYRTFSFLDKVYNFLAPKARGVEVDNALIMQCLESDEPCMISRFGSTELQTLCFVRFWPLSLLLKKRTYYNIQYASGFFPVTKKNLNLFYNIYREDVKEMDVLISWRIEEFLFKDWVRKKLSVRKTTLDCFYEHTLPWTSALANKRILVVHPFAETIKRQYQEKRNLIFENPLTLPQFKSFSVVKAVQSIAGNPVGFDSWFDALEYMKTEIDKCDYDIALLGCGAYGMPLAAHVKRTGKKAVHMGGVLQFLFGIKGKRYVDNPRTAKFINDSFVFPDEKDRPAKANVVEGGCYW